MNKENKFQINKEQPIHIKGIGTVTSVGELDMEKLIKKLIKREVHYW
jgi:proteasome assembly chaperone (PAC2) family protein